MRKIFLMTLLAFALTVGQAFSADTTTSPLRIGVVDMQTVAGTSDPAAAAKQEMETKYGKEKKELEAEGEKLRKQAEKLKDPKSTEDAKIKFLRSKQELDQKTRNFMRKVEQDEMKIRQDMVTRVFNATYQVAQRMGYNFVVDITAGGVLYAEQSMDLTQAVLAEVNKIYKENGPTKDNTAKGAKPAKSDKAGK